MRFRHESFERHIGSEIQSTKSSICPKKKDLGYLASEKWVSGVLGGRKRATLRMKSRDWNKQATEFVNAAYEIGVEPGDIQLQLTVLGYNLEISFP